MTELPNPAQNIKNARLFLGLTQEEFANLLGVSAQSVSKWECGARSPRPSTLKLINKSVWDKRIFSHLETLKNDDPWPKVLKGPAS